jgi:hypothetical protein
MKQYILYLMVIWVVGHRQEDVVGVCPRMPAYLEI